MDFNKIYNAFYKDYFHEIHYYCVKKDLSYHDAEECAQDVFLDFFRKLGVINLDDNTRGWLYAAADIAIKHFKFQNKKYTGNENIDEVSDETFAFNPFEAANAELELEEILSVLKPDDRKILTDYYVYGKTTAEFSEELGIAQVAFYQRLNRARKRLADSLNRECVDEIHKEEVNV